MSYIVRIYHGNSIQEADLTGRESLSIGSSDGDDLKIPGAGIMENHLYFCHHPGRWALRNNGPVKQNGKKITDKGCVGAGDVYAIGSNLKTAVSIYPKQADSEETVNLGNLAEVSIGRLRNNNISLDFGEVSREHAKIYKLGDTFRIKDLRSTNKTYVNNNKIDDAALNDGDVITIGAYKIVYRNGLLSFKNTGNDLEIKLEHQASESCTKGEEPETDDHTPKEYPSIQRSPRLVQEIPGGEVEIQPPPHQDIKPQINWLSVILPPLAMVAIMIPIAMWKGGGAMGLAFMLPMAFIGLIVSITNYASQIKKHRQSETLRGEKYREYLAEVDRDLEKKFNQQRRALDNTHPTVLQCLDIVKNRERRLWERMPTDHDFMSLRLGRGDLPFNVAIKTPKRTITLVEDPLVREPEKITRKYDLIHDAPITISLPESLTVGLVGDRPTILQTVKNMLLQTATHHCYSEVKVVAVFPQKESKDWLWLRWLPHTWDDNRNHRFLASDRTNARALFKTLEEMLKQREMIIKEEEIREKRAILPYYLFVIADQTLAENQLIMKYLTKNDIRQGIGVLFLFDNIGLLPNDCRVIIDAKGGKGTIYAKENIGIRTEFVSDICTDADIDDFARGMAPFRLKSLAAESKLPSSITFLQGYGVTAPAQINVAAKWDKGMAYKSLAVPIGVKANGDTFYFDIHEKKYGPHGLVAGMTGSGKTEMVQSWILSMALHFRPDEVSFVLIDFKGTGLILPFLKLPHLAGTISDLDTNIHRNLIALENELNRRKALLDHHGVSNITDYLKLFKEGKASEPLSFLFVVIDEFAEFKVQFPDFMIVMNRIFATGRTPGVFAVLLTQKPSGVVDDKMYANTRFRWCLKVASSADSRDMIKRPDAALITNAGRCYVQVGENEVFELIQTYWSGAPYNTETKSVVSTAQVSRVELNGKRIGFRPHEKKTAKVGKSEIDVVVDYIQHRALENNVPRARQTWVPKLGNRILLEGLLDKNVGFDGNKWNHNPQHLNAVIGLVDDPQSQSQLPLALDLSSEGHIAVYGAPGTGKTTLLHTLITSLALDYTPEDVNIYIMDFGGWSMGIFKDLPHLGGIANDNEEDKIEKLSRYIMRELGDRKRKFSHQGVGNLIAYRQATGEKIPAILLLLDNFAPVLNIYPGLEQFFIDLTREGGSYGIYFIVTTNNTMSLGFKMGQNIKMALALQLMDKADYISIVGKTDSLEPEKVAGRGLVKGNPPLEFQTALPIEARTDAERARNLKQLCERLSAKWNGSRAKPIPVMPKLIAFEDIKSSSSSNSFAIGLTTEDIEPFFLDLGISHFTLVSGKPGGGKSNMLMVITRYFKETGAVIAAFGFEGKDSTKMCSMTDRFFEDARLFDDYITSLMPMLQERKIKFQEDKDALLEPNIVIVIDDIRQCFDQAGEDTINRLEMIARLGKGLNVYLVIAGDCDDIVRLCSLNEKLTVALVNSPTSILLGGKFIDHSVFTANMSYAEKETEVGDHEGYALIRGKATRFKAVFAEWD